MSETPSRHTPSLEGAPETSGVPDWTFTTDPRELAFYHHHIESLQGASYGISAIARVAREMTALHSLEGCPEWWNDWTAGGLFSAIETLASHIGDKSTFLQERAEQYRAERDKPIVVNAIN